MISFTQHDFRFNFRVAGVCLYEGHVLTQTAQNMDFCVLPGGRVEIGEDSITALRREMREELGCDVETTRPIWIVEDFFVLDGERYHEISFIHEMIPRDTRILDLDRRLQTTPDGEEHELEFRWIKLDELASHDLKPAFLRDRLRDLPDETVLVVYE